MVPNSEVVTNCNGFGINTTDIVNNPNQYGEVNDNYPNLLTKLVKSCKF